MFGLSGVGKGWLAGQVRTVRPDVLHLEASALLRAAIGASGEALRTATPGVMQDNQSNLVEAFASARAGRLDRPVLFDGHSVIDNDHDLVEIPAAAIAALGAGAIVFVSADPELIRRHRMEDTRARPDRSAVTLANHQEQARAVARGFAQYTGVDFVEINAEDWERLVTVFDGPDEKTPTS
jgi:adenylate kinase